jgi:hypothetical protein
MFSQATWSNLSIKHTISDVPVIVKVYFNTHEPTAYRQSKRAAAIQHQTEYPSSTFLSLNGLSNLILLLPIPFQSPARIIMCGPERAVKNLTHINLNPLNPCISQHTWPTAIRLAKTNSEDLCFEVLGFSWCS